MSFFQRSALIAMLSFGLATPTLAQDDAVDTVDANELSATTELMCELHVWPTDSFAGVNTGLLSGFGIIGTVVDHATHKERVATVKDLMADYLPPAVQISELEKVGILSTLGLSDYRIIVHEPTPSVEQVKSDPAIKAATDVMNSKLKSGQRLTDSAAPCYGELLLTNIFYHKAMMYGSNLFVTTTYRDFSGGNGTVRKSSGAVKNPLEHFPPKSPDMVEAAKTELLDAFSKNFVEWSQKKLKMN